MTLMKNSGSAMGNLRFIGLMFALVNVFPFFAAAQDKIAVSGDDFIVQIASGNRARSSLRSITPRGYIASQLGDAQTYVMKKHDGGARSKKPRAKFLSKRELDDHIESFCGKFRHSGVTVCEPDYMLFADATPNDPSYGTLYGMTRIAAPDAWNTTTGSSSVVVGVIDTGINYNHSDLADNMWVNPGETPNDGIDNDGNGFVDDVYGYDFVNNDSNPMDGNGHGTHCAGTIGAVGNNGVGVAGVAWNIKLMALKFLSDAGSGTTSDAVRAINYATLMRSVYGVDVRVTNNSWGGGGYSASLSNAITAHNNAGILFVAAAGNDGTDNDSAPHYPSNYTHSGLISVAASDSSDNRASFSNYGATSVDLAAPGVSIYSTIHTGGYASYSGTSMAAPHVSGVAALMWSYDSDLSISDARTYLLNSADSLAAWSGFVATGGRLNADGALDLVVAAAGSPSPSPSTSPSSSPSPSASPSMEPSASPTSSPQPSQSPGASPSESPSVSPSVSPSEAPSSSPSESPSSTATPTPTATPAVSDFLDLAVYGYDENGADYPGIVFPQARVGLDLFWEANPEGNDRQSLLHSMIIVQADATDTEGRHYCDLGTERLEVSPENYTGYSISKFRISTLLKYFAFVEASAEFVGTDEKSTVIARVDTSRVRGLRKNGKKKKNKKSKKKDGTQDDKQYTRHAKRICTLSARQIKTKVEYD